MDGWTRWLAAACAASVCGAALASATGTVSFEGTTWQPADAIAYREGEGAKAETILVFSSVAFDRKDFSRDRVINAEDLTWHWNKHQTARGFQVEIPAAAGKEWDVWHLHDGGAHGINIERTSGVKVGGGKSPRVSGTLEYESGGGVSLQFDVPVEGKVEAAVEYLPAEGGEPGKVVSEFLDARTKDQYARMAGLLHPQRDTLLVGDKGAKSRYLGLAQRGTQCRSPLRLMGGQVFGDEALVAFACAYQSDGRELRGAAVLARDGDAWKVVGFLREQVYE